ncbi:MAG: carboxypeptidase-like regulatory domain-containing protein, partial [Gemmatimonadota bacterium]
MSTRCQGYFSLLAALIVGVTAAGVAQAQTGTVTGQVVDSRTLEPVSSAQVFSQQLGLGVLSGSDGRYTLLNVPAGTHELSVQRIGFRTESQEVTVTGDATTTANFEIAQDALALDAVVVTGTPGGTQQRALGNVVGRVDAGEIAQVSAVTGVQDMLGAREPGLSFTRGSGNVG